ncbi:MAG: hypothetical protein KDA86_01545 [Planctomycetaceae bacterium]|nr:hypothetical protein [Planctomycetaceae bacterium]
MQKTCTKMLVATITCVVLSPFTQAVEPLASSPLQPSHDPTQPMVTMTFISPGQDGSRRVTPEVAIYADGRVAVTSDARSSRTTTSQIPLEQWRSVQHQLFVKNRLLDFETSTMDDQIYELRQQRRRPAPDRNADVTVITVHGTNVDHEIRCHALGLTATQLPDLPCVQHVYACQECLQNIVKVVRAGGYEQVEQTLSTVNEKLERQLPGTNPLSSQDLNLVDARPDGTKYLQFSRLPGSTGTNGTLSGLRPQDRFLMVSVYERPGRPLEISIIGDTAAQ